MSFHTVVYTSNTFGVTNFDMTPATDAIIAIQNGHYLPQVPLNFYGGWFSGTLMTAIRLNTPRSRQVVPPPLYPIQNTALPPDRPHIFDRRMMPFLLNAVEEVSMQVNLGGAANAIASAVMFWGTSIDPVTYGDVWALHGTATTTASALAWTQLNVTWDQTLPAGTYNLIGSQIQSTNAICHRWIPRLGTQLWRPGALSITSLTNISDPTMYYGGWGAWLQFNTYTYPLPEVFCNGADAAHDVTIFFTKSA
jgi:hypothetical protein